MFKLLFIFILSCLKLISHAQIQKNKTPSEFISAFETSKHDTNRIRLLFQLSDFYLENSTGNKTAIDSSLFYLHKAVDIADKTHIAYWRYEAYRNLGHFYFAIGDGKSGKESFLKIANELNTSGNKRAEITVWEELFKLIHPRDSTGVTRLNCLDKIRLLYHKLNDKENEITTLKAIADVHMNYGFLDLAENELLNVLKMYESINYRKLHYTYDLLAVTNRYKGDFHKALSYSLKTIESMETTKDTVAATTFYSRVANIYRELDDPQNSVKWYWKVFRIRKYEGPVNQYMFRDAGFLARELIKLNRIKEAFDFILDIADKNKPIGIYAKASLTATLACCYNALKRDDMADKFYLNLITLTNGLEKNNEVTADVNYEAGQYFFARGQLERASFHLQRALDVSPGINTPSIVKDIHLTLFKVDSAKGNYPFAIDHIRKYQKIKDSLFNESKNRQIEEVEAKYNVKLLENETTLQQSKLQQASNTRNWILAATSLLLVIIGLLIRNIVLKQRTNRQLKIHRTEIENQNNTLVHLVNEKEWLLKEIHHRVKNNLQIVMSLLNSQSAYIDNEPARTAIHDSQHRVHAMSLIHQKLYNSENLSSINMSIYIRELATYLHDSFNSGQRVRFEFNIESIELDVSHAVPLGLILNEAITNSLKYAFPDDRSGAIDISLSETSAHHYLLSIRDNGVGMPNHSNEKKQGSLGMSLMKGLTEDIEGCFSIESNNGVIVKISFAQELPAKKPGGLRYSFDQYTKERQ